MNDDFWFEHHGVQEIFTPALAWCGVGAGVPVSNFFIPHSTEKFLQQIHGLDRGQNVDQLRKMYSPNFVDNMVVAEV